MSIAEKKEGLLAKRDEALANKDDYFDDGHFEKELARRIAYKTVSKLVANISVIPNLIRSLPNDVFADVLGLPTIWVPHSYTGCSQHAPNEHILEETTKSALRLMTGLWWDLGASDTPKHA